MGNLWFKFYGAEYLSDPKMDRLTVQERSCWLTLLCMASQSDGVIKYLSVEGLLTKSGIKFNPYDSTEWDNTQTVLQTFKQYEMIDVRENGEIEVKNWAKRQERNLTGAERVAKTRLNKKNVTNVTKVVTKGVTNVTSNRIEYNRIDKNNIGSDAAGGGTPKKEETFSFEVKFQSMKDNPRLDIKIIALYWQYKEFKFDNEEQYQSALKRDLIAAKALKGYNSKQITETMEFCNSKFEMWTLETIGKRIADVTK